VADTVVVYYTSGTTGAPKGCMLHHGWWLRIVDVDLRMNPEGRERGLCSVPFYYADPALYMCYALQTGGSVAVNAQIQRIAFTGTSCTTKA